MMLNREGIFHALPVEIGIDETGENALATCIVSYRLFEEKINGEFVDISEEGPDITAWYYIEKKDGSLNDFTIKSLKESFGWDGCDLLWMQNTDLSDHPVQITTAFERYNNADRLKVKWTNPHGSEGGGGGVTRGDESILKSIGNRLGAKLRANAGGTPANPAPPKRSAPGTAPKHDTPDSTADEAWGAFNKACPDEWSQKDAEKEWFRVIEDMFEKPAEKMTPADWGRMKADGHKSIIPF